LTNSVTFPVALGGSGQTIDDSTSPTAGLGNGGHRTRFVPALSQTVVMAQTAADKATSALASRDAAASSQTAAAGSATSASGSATTATTKASEAASSASSAATSASAAASYAVGTISDSTALVMGSVDTTKRVRMEADTNVPTASTVVLTAPGVSGTMALLSDIPNPTITYNAVSTATTLGAANARQLHDCTGAITVSFAAAATLASGWFAYIRNAGTSIVVLDPSGAETIDGAATLSLFPGQTRFLQCNGTVLRTILIDNGSADSFVSVHTPNGYGTTNTKIRRFTTVLTATGTAIAYADSATLGGSFTINEPGVYTIYASDVTATITYSGVSVNAASLVTDINGIPIANRVCMAWNGTAGNSVVQTGATVRLAVGDVIRAHAGGTGNGGNEIQFNIRKISA